MAGDKDRQSGKVPAVFLPFIRVTKLCLVEGGVRVAEERARGEKRPSNEFVLALHPSRCVAVDFINSAPAGNSVCVRE